MALNGADTDSLCLRDMVERAVAQYLADMGDTPTDNLHQRVLDEIEPSLIRTVLDHTGGNQTQAAAILGMTRSTLRNRVRRYGL